MTPSTSRGGYVGTLTRITVTSNDKSLDVGIPADMPFVDLIPGFVRELGLLTADDSFGGFSLMRTDGTLIDSAQTPVAQRVRDGERFALIVGAHADSLKVYDDVVEAVADAVEERYSPWTDSDSAKTAIAASITFLLAGAVLLVSLGRSLGASPTIAIVAAIVIAAASGVVARLGQAAAGRALMLTATVFGGAAGYLLVGPGTSLWTWPLFAAGMGVLTMGLLGIAALPDKRELALAPISIGLILGIDGLIIALTGVQPGHVLGFTMALAGTLTNGLPWLALSSTGITVVTPLSDAEITADVPDIDGATVMDRSAAGQRLLLALRAGLAVVVIVATPPVVATGLAGVLLCALCFVGMMVTTRHVYVRTDVLIMMAAGITGLILTGITTALAYPDWLPVLILVLSAGAAGIVALTMLLPGRHLRLGRLADAVDLVALALLLPLGVIASGLAGW